jgi:hypothetical protein
MRGERRSERSPDEWGDPDTFLGAHEKKITEPQPLGASKTAISTGSEDESAPVDGYGTAPPLLE